ncbi:MAG TPA: IS200/IS605 family transposase [Bacteroidales bacterium]|nr:IS200/IS605 family transposase [Bacteroidales bacterium]
MANTYTQINVHAIFSVKGRENLLNSNMRNELYAYISGILKNEKNYSLAINGFSDHVHIFFELNPVISISDLINTIKTNSSKWVNEQKWFRGKFAWQTGYAAFSYSRSQRHNVIQYIVNQEQHHRLTSFKEEYLKLLEIFEKEYDMKYVFEFYD